jgi:DnaJ-class molecular chaperone
MHTTQSRENYMPEDLSIRYAPTTCIYCKGTGRTRSSLRTCVACKGIGTYLVVRPIAELRLSQRIRSKR